MRRKHKVQINNNYYYNVIAKNLSLALSLGCFRACYVREMPCWFWGVATVIIHAVFAPAKASHCQNIAVFKLSYFYLVCRQVRLATGSDGWRLSTHSSANETYTHVHILDAYTHKHTRTHTDTHTHTHPHTYSVMPSIGPGVCGWILNKTQNALAGRITNP